MDTSELTSVIPLLTTSKLAKLPDETSELISPTWKSVWSIKFCIPLLYFTIKLIQAPVVLAISYVCIYTRLDIFFQLTFTLYELIFIYLFQTLQEVEVSRFTYNSQRNKKLQPVCFIISMLWLQNYYLFQNKAVY